MTKFPRLPLKGNLDLTYRCNNACQHCWLWLPASNQQYEELSEPEIEQIVLEARALGCRDWTISGGEPMLRDDFIEIFDFITRHARTYSLNTNGILITPDIAQLMKRPGSKMVALYGATARVHDSITRKSGSFDAALRGMALLREAGAGFTVQVVPMRNNFHQYKQMLALAESLSPYYRIGATWLNLSADGNHTKNESIHGQRLLPAEVVFLDPPIEDNTKAGLDTKTLPQTTGLLADCALRSEFHIDPYGQMSYCSYIKDSAQRYDLKTGSFRQAWEEFLPSLACAVQPDDVYRANCGGCKLRAYCRWCPAHARLETGSYTQPVPYLCAIARESNRYIQERKKNNIRFYKIAGLTIRLESDLPFHPVTFHPKFDQFEIDGPGEDSLLIRHHFSLPNIEYGKIGREIYTKPPWRIFEKSNGWVYLLVGTSEDNPYQVISLNRGWTSADIYHSTPDVFNRGTQNTLTLLSSDELLLAQVLSKRQACYLHSSGLILNEKGLLFVGHSGAGKSTLLKMVRHKGKILCDERNIIRRWPDGFHLYSTWSHGDGIKEVTAGEAPLAAILFIEKAKTNQLIRLQNPKEIIRRLPFFIIRPLLTAQWWHNTLDLVEAVAQQVPCYRLEFDKSGAVLDLLEQLTLK